MYSFQFSVCRMAGWGSGVVPWPAVPCQEQSWAFIFCGPMNTTITFTCEMWRGGEGGMKTTRKT